MGYFGLDLWKQPRIDLSARCSGGAWDIFCCHFFFRDLSFPCRVAAMALKLWASNFAMAFGSSLREFGNEETESNTDLSHRDLEGLAFCRWIARR
jgi:hypothetical protein